MNAERRMPKWVTPLGIAGALVVVLLLMIMLASRNREEVDPTQTIVDVQSTAQATSTLVEPTATSAAATDEVVQEPTAEVAATADETTAEEPTAATTEMEAYESITGFFNLMVPAGWNSEETFPGGALITANSDEALGRFSREDDLESGDLILNVGFLPFDLFRQREIVPLNIQFDAAPDIFMQSVLPVFRVTDNATTGDVQLISLSDELEAGMLAVTDGNHDGLILMFMAGDEVVAVVSAVGHTGELNTLEEIVFAIASGVTFSGAHEALYAALLQG